MDDTFLYAFMWLGLALVAIIVARMFKVTSALIEICIGAIAGFIANSYFGKGALHSDDDWLKFIASAGAVLLTFLSGTELDSKTLRRCYNEIIIIGIVGFTAPFIGCTLLAYHILGWSSQASLLAGVALSTTSMAVVYAVIVEYGFHKTDFGKGVLGACFVNDLATVIALGLLFSPFTYKTVIFIVTSVVAFGAMPFITSRVFPRFQHRGIRTKWILLVLFGLGALAIWSGSEAVLPAYILGMVLAEVIGKDDEYISRMRTMTIGFFTPFYFLRAGSLVSIPDIIIAPLVLFALLGGKVVSKTFGLYPLIGRFKTNKKEQWYYTLLMSTGLTFGTISAIFGYSHGIINQAQYSFLVAAVILSAVIPTIVANSFFLPKHLIIKQRTIEAEREDSEDDGVR